MMVDINSDGMEMAVHMYIDEAGLDQGRLEYPAHSGWIQGDITWVKAVPGCTVKAVIFRRYFP